MVRARAARQNEFAPGAAASTAERAVAPRDGRRRALEPRRAPAPVADAGEDWARWGARESDFDASVRGLVAPAIAVGALGVLPPPPLTERVRSHASALVDADPDQLYASLTAAFIGRHPDRALQWLLEAGLLAVVLPELVATVDLVQEAGRRHKDVWEHTKIVTWQCVPRPDVRWAAILHDIGKVPTRRFIAGGKVTFHGHAEVGARMFRRGPARRVGFPAGARERVHTLIAWHLRPGQYDGTWTDSAVRRFDREIGPALKDLLDLSRADITTKHAHKRKACLRMISALSRRIVALRELDADVTPLPPGLGNVLMERLGLPPGPHLGALRQRLEALVDAGELTGGEGADYYVEQVSLRGLLEGLEIVSPRRRGDPP